MINGATVLTISVAPACARQGRVWPASPVAPQGGRREVERWGIARTAAADGHEVALARGLGCGACGRSGAQPPPETRN